MTNDSDGPSPPDVTYTTEGLSRRDLIAAGATAAVSGMAGCADMARDAGLGEEEVWDDDAEEGTPTQAEMVEGYELEIEDVTWESVEFTLRQSLRPDERPERLEGTIRVYWAALHGGSEIVVAEEEASLTGVSQDHELSIDFGDHVINIPQELEVRFESPQLDDSEVTLGTDDTAYLPFDNEARDERSVRALGPKFASEDKWNDPSDPVHKVEIWYNELDESPFNIPALEHSQYTETTVDGDDWFDLHDIELTALIRVPILTSEFAESDGERQGPYYDWTVVTLRQSELEYLEALYWNSPATMKLRNSSNSWDVGSGGLRQEEVTDSEEWGSTVTMESRQVNNPIAQDSNPTFDYFVQGVFHKEVGLSDKTPDEVKKGNPLKFVAGRSVCRRWAEKITAAFEEKPYQLSPPAYHKLSILKAIIGDGLNYGFQPGTYHKSPEENIVQMFKYGTSNDSDGADCVSATNLFVGIGAWLVDATPLFVFQRYDTFGHILSGWADLEVPDFQFGYLNYLNYEDEIGEPYTSTNPNYEYWVAECTEAVPSIGFNRTSKGSDQRIHMWSDGTKLPLTTHIRLNDNWEPDIDGEIRDKEDEGMYSFYHDPFQAGHLYYFEEQ